MWARVTLKSFNEPYQLRVGRSGDELEVGRRGDE